MMVVIFLPVAFRPSYGVTGSVDAERVYTIAIKNNDISICDKVHLSGFADVTSIELQSECYELYVKAHPDQGVCARIGNTFRCVDAQATTLSDASACLPLQYDIAMERLCVLNVAFDKHDPNTCHVLANPDSVQRCKQMYQSRDVQKH
jgi:hypothetical protein